jgi:Tol biopolymer transport system component
MTRDGSGVRDVGAVSSKITGGLPLAEHPTWSPDGTKIAFAAGPNSSETHIYVVNEDGSGLDAANEWTG